MVICVGESGELEAANFSYDRNLQRVDPIGYLTRVSEIKYSS